MVPEAWINGLIGGILIGIASSIVLIFSGRILGISGVVGGIIKPKRHEFGWRLAALFGLFTGGAIMYASDPTYFQIDLQRPPLMVVAAGLLVGFGTRLGNGCTSGHGVCGLSRFSFRSLIATLVFMATGIITVFVVGQWGGVP